MSGEDKKNVTISKNNAGFPSYLDFDKLRSEGIAYLGKLSGKLWTDHNVHDPGITILEELCYALLDLGYRTNIPVEDILARYPAGNSKENNFFSPDEILSCNPLTIMDYRKLLIDIPGIRNAWLYPATDITNICNSNNTSGIPDSETNLYSTTVVNNDRCEDFLNGIYHVFIETEIDVDTHFQQDNPELEAEERQDFINDITDRVKKVLMAHRNLCEDFADIFILCKLKLGVCASIEVKEESEVENVYLSVANKLQEYFSNAPKFYTLSQLLDKGKSMEEIYAGRAYSKHSHGFVDNDELDAIELKKEIHTSDIYNAILEVAGVKKVSKLRLMNCGKHCDPDKNTYWNFHLPENHVPDFSMNCSGFEFTKNGMQLPVDQEKYETQLELGWLHTGKILYTLPSPYLDSPIPNGIFQEDIDHYYSIQKDFPSVYGIGEGDLSENVSDKRKSQALQLKGYLFFFDQMLANYLSQLKNIRQLFSFEKGDKKTQHTYFLNTISTVPEINKLLRFANGEDSSLGTNGALLAFPVSKKDWHQLDISKLTAAAILESLQPFTFDSLFGLYEATDLLRNDFVNVGETNIKTIHTADGLYLYTIESSTDDFILVSKKISNNENEALRHASSVQYAGVFEKNYRSFITNDNSSTFNIELNIDSYTDYLGILVESDELYLKRRKDFLSHLMSRFAEQFTDFVILNWKPEEETGYLDTVEKYLSSYPEISRNRGRAYDYNVTYCQKENQSGFEKKIKALTGMPVYEKNLICPFVVEPYDESYVLDFSGAGIANFHTSQKFDLVEDAIEAASSIITSFGDRSKYDIKYLSDKKEYQVLLNYDSHLQAVYNTTFANSNDAENLIAFFTTGVSQQVPPEAVVEHSWTWTARILNYEGNIIKTSSNRWTSESDIIKGIDKLVSKPNDSKKWVSQKEHPFSGKLFYDIKQKEKHRFIDISAFNFDIKDTIIGKPGKFTYEVLDKSSHSFKINPLIDFNKRSDAEAHGSSLLLAALEEKNFEIILNPSNNLYRLEILLDGIPEGVLPFEFTNREEAQKSVASIIETIKKYSYTLDLLKSPVGWKFRYTLGRNENTSYTFYSDHSFTSEKAAEDAAGIFYRNSASLQVKLKKDIISLKSTDNTIPSVEFAAPGDQAVEAEIEAVKILEDRQLISRLASMNDIEEIKSFVRVEGANKFGTYVYRLINKNKTPAVFSESFPDSKTAGEKRKQIASLSKKAFRNVPSLCMGMEETLDSKGVACFRYQIIFYNVNEIPGNRLILFSSTQAFSSPDDATNSFNENYLHILRLASDKKKFEKNISISPAEIFINVLPLQGGKPVFIPQDTLKLLQEIFGEYWIEKLIDLVKSYPVKIIDADSKLYAEIFCADYKIPDLDCKRNGKNWKYYFSMTVSNEVYNQFPPLEWRSTISYDSAEEAMEDYRYFSRLLLFTGNYFTDCGCQKTIRDNNNQTNTYVYKIYIHEVLAQSIDWFETEEGAWGVHGIEKFICANQSEQAIKNYERKENCCYSLYITCGNGLIEHPCKYDTVMQRDIAIENLYKQLNDFRKNNSYQHTFENGSIYLKDEKGLNFAQNLLNQQDQQNLCEYFIILAEDILSKEGFFSSTSDGSLLYTVGGSTLQSSVKRSELAVSEIDLWKREWKKMLWNWACYFPIIREKIKNKNGGRTNARNEIAYKYCIEIKLPGFNSCNEKTYQPCESNYPQESSPFCDIAWKGVCCYSSCDEALRSLELAKGILVNRNNYHATFDCECNSFGIALHSYNPKLIGSIPSMDTSSDIIAVNPQCYETTRDVCKAADTVLQLANSQGMHLVEHILLRPIDVRDCECRYHLGNCSTDCEFPDYKFTSDGICSEEDRNICFKPGTDPYSFIATVVLPAWSGRFKKEADRLAFEKILYREAPAHVLLRILWLKPQDFCRFESVNKKWRNWLAGKDACIGDFNVCQFIDLLFDTNYQCWNNCEVCLPCSDNFSEKPLPCLEENTRINRQSDHGLKDLPFGFLNQVNNIFCFETFCTESNVSANVERTIAGSKFNETGVREDISSNSSAIISKQKDKKRIGNTASKNDSANDKRASNLPDDVSLRSQARNSRLIKYKNVVSGVLEQSGNILASKVDVFLNSEKADARSLETLVTDIIHNKNKDSRFLTKKQQLLLIRSAVCFYLDKLFLNENKVVSDKQFQSIIERLVKARVDLQSIYNYWDAAEVAKLNTEIDTDQIRQLFTVGKK